MLNITSKELIEIQNFRVTEAAQPGSQDAVRNLHRTYTRLMAAEPGGERAMNAKKDWQLALKALALSEAEQSAKEKQSHEQYQSLSPAEKELALIERDKARHAKDQEAETARRAHANAVKPTITKLEATRNSMLAKPDQFSQYDVFLVERAIAQVQAANGDAAVAKQYVADAEAAVASRNKTRGQAVDLSLAALDAQRVALLAERTELSGQSGGSTYSVAEAQQRLDVAIATHGRESSQALCADYALSKSKEAEVATAATA
jgi:hypothetical protein